MFFFFFGYTWWVQLVQLGGYRVYPTIPWRCTCTLKRVPTEPWKVYRHKYRSHPMKYPLACLSWQILQLITLKKMKFLCQTSSSSCLRAIEPFKGNARTARHWRLISCPRLSLGLWILLSFCFALQHSPWLMPCESTTKATFSFQLAPKLWHQRLRSGELLWSEDWSACKMQVFGMKFEGRCVVTTVG